MCRQVSFTVFFLVFTWIVQENDGAGNQVLSEDMLDILDLEAVPKPMLANRRLAAPRFMLDLYTAINARQHGQYHPHVTSSGGASFLDRADIANALAEADLVMSFPNHANRTYGTSQGYYFDMRDVPAYEGLLSTSLHIFKRSYPWLQSSKEQLHIAVHRVTDEYSHSTDDTSEEDLVVRSSVSVSHTGWIEFNVASLVRHWLNFPRDNLGLRVVVSNDRGGSIYPSQVGIVDPFSADEEQAFMVAFFKKTQKVLKRKTRSTSRKARNYNSYENFVSAALEYTSMEECHRESFVVKFSDLKWQDWIIAPDSYEAHYCAGRCRFPLHLHLNATNHAIVQTLAALYNSAIPQTHCAPITLSSISVLHFDDYSNVVLKKYQRMVAESCGCH